MRFIAVRSPVGRIQVIRPTGLPAINLYFSCPDMAKPCRSDKKNTRCHKMRFIAMEGPRRTYPSDTSYGLPAINLYFFCPDMAKPCRSDKKIPAATR